ncbi:class I poly(R)-hydroxyalkanoic acid synthase [Variovorax sp. WS11]|uniref:PHA/PHB synthase family protein n=1 Tax=Variovorax sp. WS11 TaxID=1105204 RepID=UPI000D0DA9D4|nr:class I poly(R)-hydroxyalkanoic acid synthase [Variovorax sp. WS11]NDZ18192.1 class I poly(R)-hydroxyalkanoic acid synthase [Variovorax sp. WS11]PSL80607.1 class I poly(R)-hydroxyalkanoic acid synthase [Variovorax sp. WS11]
MTPSSSPDFDPSSWLQAWQQGLSQGHLQFGAWMRSALETVPFDARGKAQMDFALRQVVDAMNPANSLATNPEAMQAALDSGGASLVEGACLFLADVAKGRISMSDDAAFEVGRNVATSPGSVVFENELMQLVQYTPSTAKVHKRPLVIVPPCINKFYILDLQPANSLVAHAVAQGHTVFLVSWRNVSAEQGDLGWDDYVEQGVLRALEVARSIARAEQVSTLGFCIGGTLLASALAVAAARGEKPAASVTLLTAMLDFSDTGELGLMVDEAMVATREATIGRGGLLKGRELATVFAALRANDLIWPYVINGYLKGKAPAAFDLLYWNGDDTNLPGPMYCWYLRNTYLENKLREPGGTVQCGVPVDLSRIDAPAFVYASREDHIVPWKTAYAGTRLLGGETRFVLGASGHIAGVINPPAKKKRNHWVGDLAADAGAWLDGAQSIDGSWWPGWSDWLATHAGAKVAARSALGSAEFPVIEPAPGRYVKAKAG